MSTPCDEPLDLLLLAPAGHVLLVDARGGIEIVPDPCPSSPTIAGLRINPDLLCTLRAVRASGLSVDELLARAEQALADWPSVAAAHGVTP